MEGKRLKVANISTSKNKVRGLTLPDFKTYYETTVIETVQYQQNNKRTDEWNRIKSRQTNPHT